MRVARLWIRKKIWGGDICEDGRKTCGDRKWPAREPGLSKSENPLQGDDYFANILEKGEETEDTMTRLRNQSIDLVCNAGSDELACLLDGNDRGSHNRKHVIKCRLDWR